MKFLKSLLLIVCVLQIGCDVFAPGYFSFGQRKMMELDNAAQKAFNKGNLAKAEKYWREAIAEDERGALGPDPWGYYDVPYYARKRLVELCITQRRYSEAEPIIKKVLQKYDIYFTGRDNLMKTAWALDNLALIHTFEGKIKDAEEEFRRSFSIYQNYNDSVFTPNTPEMAELLNHYSIFLKKLNRWDLAAQYEGQAAYINSLQNKKNEERLFEEPWWKK